LQERRVQCRTASRRRIMSILHIRTIA
jgi:hypothetical protein